MSTVILRGARVLSSRTTTTSHLLINHICSTSSSTSDTSAVSTAVSVLIHRRSKSRWSTLRSLFPQGFTPSQVSQIVLQIRNNPHLALRFFLFTTNGHHSPSSLDSYATIIHILARARLKSCAKSLIKSAFKEFELVDGDDSGGVVSGKKCKLFRALVETYRLCDSAPFVFDLLINSLLEMNKLDLCVDIIRMLQSRRVYLDVSTCNHLVSMALKVKACFFGYDLYKEVFGCHTSGDSVVNHKKVNQGVTNCKLMPNVHTFNELMLSFRRNGVLDMVEEVWIQMVQLNCKPNLCSYNIMMAAYCEEGDMEKAEFVWEELRVKGLNPDVVSYNTLIGGYCKKGEVDTAEEFYREMGLHSVEGTCVTYQHLIKGYCLAGDVDSAMLLYNDMRSKGFRLDCSTVDSLVRLLSCKRTVSEALELFRIAMDNADFVARESSYELLIRGLCDVGNIKEALKLQTQMAGKGFKPNPIIYGAFIDGYLKLGNIDEAEKLRGELIQI